MKRTISMLVIHCSDSGPNTTVEDIRKWHTDPPPKGRGWKDIGYHYVIYPDGSIHKGRDENEIGAHCEGDNLFSVGICLIGRTEFTQPQFDSLFALVVDLRERFGFSNASIFGHRDRPSGKRQGKTCPNFNVRERFPI